MDKDRLNQEEETMKKDVRAEETSLPCDEPAPVSQEDEDLGEELSPEELDAAPAVYEEEEPDAHFHACADAPEVRPPPPTDRQDVEVHVEVHTVVGLHAVVE